MTCSIEARLNDNFGLRNIQQYDPKAINVANSEGKNPYKYEHNINNNIKIIEASVILIISKKGEIKKQNRKIIRKDFILLFWMSLKSINDKYCDMNDLDLLFMFFK